jgi:cell division protein FtsL
MRNVLASISMQYYCLSTLTTKEKTLLFTITIFIMMMMTMTKIGNRKTSYKTSLCLHRQDSVYTQQMKRTEAHRN